MPASSTTAPPPTWAEALSKFGASCAEKLAGPGEQEAAIRSPLEVLVARAGRIVGIPAVLHDEVRDPERQVRPDYGVSVDQKVMGYIEVKAPGRSIDPAKFTGHDLRQWRRQQDLPNLIYTNGIQWRLYRDGNLLHGPVVLTDLPLAEVGSALAPTPGLEQLLTDFLRWKAAPITSVGALVRAVAPLTRLLRGEVTDQLAAERRAMRAGASRYDQPFLGLAEDWRRLLFPHADDDVFADGYAQTVTFALLLARTNDIDLADRSLHDVGAELGTAHSLMGRALQLLTDVVQADFKVTLDLLVGVIGAVRWDKIRTGKRDVYLYLYEEFLDVYDPQLRQASGTYYTPHELVTEMVRLTEEVLTTRLGKVDGFGSADVFTVDPAMGTGTYLHTILQRAEQQVRDTDGPGAVPGALSEMVRRMAGFELQMGPFAVAELRIADLLTGLGATPPAQGLNLYVTDTLDDPHATQTQLASGLQSIAKSRARANRIKAKQAVTVVIGNPPYRELVAGSGSWVENGSDAHGPTKQGILADYLSGVPGKLAAKLKNLYVYFYRWATWKVWESTPADQAGVVCFVTTAGYLTGPAFTTMRRYLRQHASEGWIIDLSPEGQTPDVPTRLFPKVRQPLAIGLFVRHPDSDPGVPAAIRYTAVHGRRETKYAALQALTLDDPERWHATRSGWTDPFTAAAGSAWDNWPSADQLLPWYSPGVFPTRTWVYAPSTTTLQQRWARLVAETDLATKTGLLKAESETHLSKGHQPIPGTDTMPGTETPLSRETRTENRTVQVGYRAFDRQHLIADSRLIHRARPTLWHARQPGQVYVVELHRNRVSSGPGLVFSHLIPDFHYFKGSEGGRTLPFLHPNGEPNLATGLTQALAALLDQSVDPDDVLAYLAAITAHPAYTQRFAAELTTPGIHVPVTASPDLWSAAVKLGQEVLWVHTYGQTFVGDGQPAGDVRYPAGDPRRVQALTAVTQLPQGHNYHPDTQELHIADGRFGPITAQTAGYTVGGRQIIKSWVDYRSAEPAGKRSSPLDDLNPAGWEHAWTGELLDLLSALTRLTNLQPAQQQLLDEILDGPLVTITDLATAGVSWPTDTDRKPRYTHQTALHL